MKKYALSTVLVLLFAFIPAAYGYYHNVTTEPDTPTSSEDSTLTTTTTEQDSTAPTGSDEPEQTDPGTTGPPTNGSGDSGRLPSEPVTTGIEHEDIGITSEDEEGTEESQYNESDFDFVVRLLEFGGIDISSVDVDASLGEGDPDRPLVIGQVYDEIHVKGVEVRGWDPAKKEELNSLGYGAADIDSYERLTLFAARTVSSDANVEEIALNFGKIKFDYIFPIRILGFIDADMESEATIIFGDGVHGTIDDADRVKVKFPWWHVFGRKGISAADIERSYDAKLQTIGEDAELANIDLQSNTERSARAMFLISNIMKAHHDTAMSVIRKIGG